MRNRDRWGTLRTIEVDAVATVRALKDNLPVNRDRIEEAGDEILTIEQALMFVASELVKRNDYLIYIKPTNDSVLADKEG